MREGKTKKNKKGWYVVIATSSAGKKRIYAYHKDVSVVLQAFASLSKNSKEKCDIIYADSPENALDFLDKQ